MNNQTYLFNRIRLGFLCVVFVKVIVFDCLLHRANDLFSRNFLSFNEDILDFWVLFLDVEYVDCSVLINYYELVRFLSFI